MANHLYTKRYAKDPDVIHVPGFAIPVPMPIMPKLEDMTNFGVQIDQQVFRRYLPLRGFEQMSKESQEPIAREMWHLRLNGEWQIIKGLPTYIPGTAWFYFNFWYAEVGRLPDFRITALRYYYVWEYVRDDPESFGMLIVKARREGATETTLCAGYEMVTRYRESGFGMQNINDVDAKKNFKRVVKAHRKMHPAFRPVHKGSAEPEDELVFEYPKEMLTVAGMKAGKKKGQYLTDAIGSRITFRPTVLRQYDGERLRFYHLDEAAKIDVSKMHILEQWAVVQPTLSLNMNKNIVGKAVFTSTVEDFKDGAAVRLITQAWGESDPLDLGETGRTGTGLFRYWRNFVHTLETDHWGYPKEKEGRDWWSKQVADLRRRGDSAKLSSFYRKFPDTIDQALQVPATQCLLLPHLLEEQKERIEMTMRTGAPVSEVEVVGDLIWESGLGSDVRWVANPTGHFKMNQAPIRPNARGSYLQGEPQPGSPTDYSIGVDSVDHFGTTKKSGYSFPAVAVYRPFNADYEDTGMADEQNISPEQTMTMRTSRFTMTYMHREPDPRVFYEAVLKIAVYYGAKIFAERDKPGVQHYFEDKGFRHYLAYKIARGSDPTLDSRPGAASRAPVIDSYIGKITSFVSSRHYTIRSLDMLNNFRKFTGDNRSECDMVVACGFALLQGAAIEYQNKAFLKKQTRGTGITRSPFRQYSLTNG